MQHPTENEIWYLLENYFSKHGFVRHQIESFDYFINSMLPRIVQELPPITVRQEENEEHVITLCNVSVSRPTTTDANGNERELLPSIARFSQLTYSSTVLVDVVHDISKNGEHKERRLFREVCLCRLPMMLNSTCCWMRVRPDPMECSLDQGGYFIVSGCEKVLVAQEKLHHNVPYVFSLKQPSRFALQCEVRSCNEQKMRSTSSIYLNLTNVKRGEMPEMTVTLPFLQTQVSVLALFKLLNVPTREEVMAIIVDDASSNEFRIFSAILDNDSAADMTLEMLYDQLGREGTKEITRERRQRYIDHIIHCEVLPHQGLTNNPETLRLKARFLGLMVRKLLRVHAGVLPCDDRDHFAAKRIDCAGVQFGLLFRQVLRVVHKSISMQLFRAGNSGKLQFTNVGNIVAGKKLTQAFRFALATGNWGILSTRGTTANHGVAQQLSRMTIPATVSLLRKVSTPMARETKNPKPRQLHSTTWGLLCPMDTPEGSACGLTKSLAMLAHVRIGTFNHSVEEPLRLLQQQIPEKLIPAIDANTSVCCSGIPLLINGVLTMYTGSFEDAKEVADELRRMRRRNLIPFDTSVSLQHGFLYVDTDAGCLLRPLFRKDAIGTISRLLREAPSHIDLVDYLMRHDVIEFIDKQEEAELRVAISPLREPEDGWGAYTHSEIDASMIVGLCGSCIPFAEHNQAPRNTYQSAMMKQALGIYSTNYPLRMDTIAYALVSPQRPLVTTRMDALLGASEAPSGVNAIVCIMCYTGQNQEDSIIVNRAALERGMFRSIKFHTYRDEEHQNGGTDAERFENIGKLAGVAGKRDSNYDLLGNDGIIEVGCSVHSNDVLLSKTVTTTELGEGARRQVKRDMSTTTKHDKGIVDAVLRVVQKDGTHLVKVKLRETRTPIVGDKFSSRMGQKGVVGLILSQEDMPFTEDGIVPDIVVNPHAIPSRMTLGQLAECLSAILCTLTGQRGDGTLFRNTSLEHMCDELEKNGYDRHGRVKLHNGFTGEAFDSLIFMGPTYYQRLRHHAADKDHARSRGPKHMLTRQPTEGRAREGGLRFGEMERDCVISHGAAEFLRDRLLDNSDPSTVTLPFGSPRVAERSPRVAERSQTFVFVPPPLFVSEKAAEDYAEKMGGGASVTFVGRGPGADYEVSWAASAVFASEEAAKEFALPRFGDVTFVARGPGQDWEVTWDAPEPQS